MSLTSLVIDTPIACLSVTVLPQNETGPLVSVIIPTYNRCNHLKRAIESVLAQTYEPFEVIVVDDASTDETPEMVLEIEDDRIKFIRHETNRHVSAARNTGITHANGDYLAFLDDDDVWYPEKLIKQCQLLQRTPDSTKFVYCWMDIYDGENIVDELCPELSGDIFLKTLPSQPITNISTLLVEREAIEQVGNFDESLPRGNDGDFIRRLSKSYTVDYVPERLVRYNAGEHHRITSWESEDIRNAIRGQRVKFEKFGETLDAHPELAARINAKIAVRHCQLGEWKTAFQYYWRAMRAAPFSPTLHKEVGVDLLNIVNRTIRI